MILPCDCRVNCPGTDSPFANLSSEGPDRIVYFGFNSGWNDNVPPLGSDFTKTGCVYQCVTFESQDAADACAAQQELLCAVGTPTDPGWPDPTDPGRMINVFTNDAVFCNAICPDGLPFTYTIPAGRYSALSQLQADRIASSYACKAAHNLKICLSTIPTEACVHQAYNATITATSEDEIAFWSFGGDLPSGLNLNFTNGSSTATITGTPTAEGSHTFFVVARDGAGNFMQKYYTICVIEIGPVQTTLPNGAPSIPYSQQFSATSCAGTPLQWLIATGTLPPGLTLDMTTGLLSGTPTTPGTYTFTIEVITLVPL